MKKIVCTFAVLALVLSIIGCSWETPEKVKVKTNAEYNFSLGNLEKDLTTDLSINTLLGNVTLPNNVNIYDYWPGRSGTEQRVLMSMTLSEIPIDLGQYFDPDSLTSGLSIDPIEKDFEIPSFNIDTDIGNLPLSSVNDSINNMFSLSGYTVSSINLAELLGSNANFSTISYRTGSFFVVECDEAITGSVTIVSNGVPRTADFNDENKAEIDISNFTFDVTSLTMSFSNAPATPVHFTATPSSSSQVAEITGFTTSDVTIPINQTFNALESISSVESCTIKQGSFTIGINIPSSWSGVTSTPVTVSATNMDAENIAVDKELKLKINNATIVFANQPAIHVTSDINKISATVSLGSSTGLSKTEHIPLPDALLDIADVLTLKQCGIKGTYTNTLPAGNDITITASSAFFGIPNTTATVESNKTNGQISLLSDNAAREVHLGSGTDEFNEVVFAVSIGLPGGAADKITLTDVEPGRTYSLSLSLEPVIDWESISINPSAITSALGAGAGSQTIDTGFNPGTIFDTLGETLESVIGDDSLVSELQLPECNLYLFITKPDIDAFEHLSFLGSSVEMYYKAGSSRNDPKTILESTTDLALVNQPNVRVSRASDGSDIVTTQITGASLSLPIADVLNNGKKTENQNATLCVDYSLQIAGVNGSSILINKSDLSNSSGSIGIYAYIDVPLRVSVGDPVQIELKDLVRQSVPGDLFGRSDASGLDEVAKYLDAFESVSVAYNPKSLPVSINGNGLKFEVNFTEGENGPAILDDPIEITIGNRANALTVTRSDVEKLLNAYPVYVEPVIKIDGGTYSIPRTKKVAVDISLKIKTDGTIDLM